MRDHPDTPDDDMDLDELRRVHDGARARLPQDGVVSLDDVALNTETRGALAAVAARVGFDLLPPGARPTTWRCIGRLGEMCTNLVEERTGRCPECAEADARHVRTTALRDARASLPEGALTFRQVRALPTVDSRIVDPFEEWRREHASLTVLGTSGLGKTVSAMALIRRVVDVAERKPLPRDAFVFARRARFVAAKDLGQARRRHKLGDGEAPLERTARTASLLVLDDLGKEDERDQQAVVDAILARPIAGPPMIVTSELTADQIALRYGVAIRRRLLERAKVIEVFEGAAVRPRAAGGAR